MNESNRHTAFQLYYEGSDFLYGLLYRVCFPYDDFTLKPRSISDGSLSFALLTMSDESYDGSNDDDGSSSQDINIDAEIKCLRQFLPLKHSSSNCTIVVLSNHVWKVERIASWIASSKRQCTVVRSFAEEMTDSNSISALQFAAQMSRTGVIGAYRLATFQLLVEGMEYQRQTDARRRMTAIPTSVRNSTLQPLLRCDLGR
jgi:hypothetical protein